MSRAVERYKPSRKYAMLASLALLAALGTGWAAGHWGLAWAVASALFVVTAALTLLLALRPAVEIHETHLRIGKRAIFWNEIQRLDRISVMDREPWTAPLLVRLTLPKKQEILLFHTGDVESCVGLLRQLYRNAHNALLDGSPYAQFWGEQPITRSPLALPPPRLLLAEDEDEVERMFQRLRATGRLDGDDHSHSGQSTDQRGSDEQ